MKKMEESERVRRYSRVQWELQKVVGQTRIKQKKKMMSERRE